MSCEHSWIWDLLLPNLLSGIAGSMVATVRQWASSWWLARRAVDRLAPPPRLLFSPRTQARR